MSSFRETQHSCADGRSDQLAFLREPLCVRTYRAKNGSSYTHAHTHSHTCVDLKQTRMPSLVQPLTLHVHAGNHLDSCRSMITCILLIQTQLPSVVDKEAHMQPHTRSHTCMHLPTYVQVWLHIHTRRQSSSVPELHLGCVHVLCCLHPEKHADQPGVSI